MDVLAAFMSLPTLAIVWFGGSIVVYAWACACGQFFVGLVNFYLSAKFIDNRWTERVLLPAVMSTCGGSAAVFMIRCLHLPLLGHVVASAFAYFSVNLIVMRMCFSTDLTSVLLRMPRGNSLVRWMRLKSGSSPVQAASQPGG